jgi:hypothetical protein
MQFHAEQGGVGVGSVAKPEDEADGYVGAV